MSNPTLEYILSYPDISDTARQLRVEILKMWSEMDLETRSQHYVDADPETGEIIGFAWFPTATNRLTSSLSVDEWARMKLVSD